jgi:signal peptidase II
MFLFWLYALLVFVLDRITKFRIMRTMVQGETRAVLGDFFHITSVRNTGAAFGLFQGNHRIFVVISLVAIVLVLLLYQRSGRGHRLRTLSLGLILGGALGNLYDRVRYREVVDFLEFSVGRFHWPVFNVADSAVTVGVLLLITEIYVQGSHKAPEPAELPSPPGEPGG